MKMDNIKPAPVGGEDVRADELAALRWLNQARGECLIRMIEIGVHPVEAARGMAMVLDLQKDRQGWCEEVLRDCPHAVRKWLFMAAWRRFTDDERKAALALLGGAV